MRYLLLTILALGCTATPKSPLTSKAGGSTLTVTNSTEADTTAYFAFGADSVVLPTDWSFCAATGKLNCSFTLKKGETKELPLQGKYLNATVSFGAPASCGSTKGELNLNNPKWYDIGDVSLVDGFSNKIALDMGGTKLGPPAGATGNEKAYGVYPLGCDICVARQSPPCGMAPGKDGCKGGDQYHPDVPCQHQGTVMGGGTKVTVTLVP